MKTQSQRSLHLESGGNLADFPMRSAVRSGKPKFISDHYRSALRTKVRIISKKISRLFELFKANVLHYSAAARENAQLFLKETKTAGFTSTMDEYEKRKLGIFNLLNLFQYCTGLIVPAFLVVNESRINWLSSLVIIFPPMISVIVLFLNSRKKYDAAQLCYFILYPFFTSLVYLSGIDLGMELYFILYGILSVFFLKELGYIIFCLGFSMVNYYVIAVVLNGSVYNLKNTYHFLYLLNQLMAIGFIFYGLYLIKKENTEYQVGILDSNEKLEKLNREIQRQKEEITEKAILLEDQATLLKEMDSFKTRLFSIVSHDLKNPLYALRNLFVEIQQKRIPAKGVQKLIPQVIKDLNYTTGLTDNLLHWARSQMQAGSMMPQDLNVSALIEEIFQQQRLQAEIKGVKIVMQVTEPMFIHADRDMISLVIRNLLSNAIKFTPAEGTVTVGCNDLDTSVEIFVSDTGAGIPAEALEKLKKNDYFTTRGTANEPGTGLGLMLVKEFLVKNKGQLHIESTPGAGSTFSFALPKPKFD